MKFLHTADWQMGMRAESVGRMAVLTATDTRRLARLLVLLEEASDKLQVVILTCHPERYQALAAAALFYLEPGKR